MKNETQKSVHYQPEKITQETATQEQIETAHQEVSTHLRKPPTREEVRQWLEHDINAAIYSLSAIKNFPALLDKMANEMYQEAMKTPGERLAEKEQIIDKNSKQ